MRSEDPSVRLAADKILCFLHRPFFNPGCAACLFIASLLLVVTITSASAERVLGLVNTGEVFESSDGGVSWTVRSTLAESDAIGIAATETVDELVIVTRTGSLYRSSDAGVSWIAVGTVAASDVVDMVVRSNGDIVLMTQRGIVWQSTDDGATFTSLATLAASNYTSMCEDEFGNLCALTETGEITKSSDGGVTWNVVGVIPVSDAVAIRALDSSLFVSTGTGDIAQSTDLGATWTFVGTLSQVNVSALTTLSNGLAATTHEGNVATSSDGVTWTWVGSINQLMVVGLGSNIPTVIGIGSAQTPPAFSFDRAWPNPVGANPVINLGFRGAVSGEVRLGLYDVAGRRVAQHASQFPPGAGYHTLAWSLPPLPSGVYFLRASTISGASGLRKIVIVR